MKSLIILVLVAVAVTASPVKDAELCTDCKAVFGDVKTRLASPQFSGAIVDGVDKYFCNFLLIGKATCKQLTQTIVQTAVGFASNAIVPETICAMLQYCSAPVPNQEFQNHLTESLNMANRFISLTKEGADLCVDCTTLFTDVKARLSSDAFAQGVSSQINKYTCDLLLVGKEYCESMVQNVVSNTFKSAAGVIDPVSICTLLTYCQPPTPPQPLFHPDHMDMIDRVFGLVGSNGTDDPTTLCTDCMNIFDDLQAKLADPNTVDEIVTNLNQYTCDFLPIGQEYCTTFLTSVVKGFLDVVADIIDADMICTFLQYCQSPPPTTPSYIDTQKRNVLYFTASTVEDTADLCADCKAVFGDVKTRLASPTFASAIAENLEKFTCNYLPFYQTECTTLVNTSVSSILGLMASFVDPPMICTTLAYCAA